MGEIKNDIKYKINNNFAKSRIYAVNKNPGYADNADNLTDFSDIYSYIPDNPYLLLTPGPLSTSKSVRAAMLFDLCTWDEDYRNLTQKIRKKLTDLATNKPDKYTAILMQGSGTYCIEAVLGSVISKDSKLLILSKKGN